MRVPGTAAAATHGQEHSIELPTVFHITRPCASSRNIFVPYTPLAEPLSFGQLKGQYYCRSKSTDRVSPGMIPSCQPSSSPITNSSC